MNTSSKKDQMILDLSHIVDKPQSCPYCKEMMDGPFTKYKKRDFELYFDLEKKFQHCPFCGMDVEVVDFQVILEKMSSMLPPDQARLFSMKNIRLFEILPEKTVELFLAILEDTQQEIMLPVDNLICVNSMMCNSEDDCHCSMCIRNVVGSS